MTDEYQVIVRDFLNRDPAKMTRQEVEQVLNFIMGYTTIPPEINTPKDDP